MKKSKDLVQNFNPEILKLQKENEALQVTITRLLADNDRLLKLDRKPKLILNASPEQELIQTQINNLNSSSRVRNLTLEETKMFDLLIKNQRLLNDESTLNADFKNLPSDVSEDELMKIAEGTDDERSVKGTGEKTSVG